MFFGRRVPLAPRTESVPLPTASAQTTFTTSEFEIISSERKDVTLDGSVVSVQEQSSAVAMLKRVFRSHAHGERIIRKMEN